MIGTANHISLFGKAVLHTIKKKYIYSTVIVQLGLLSQKSYIWPYLMKLV